MITTERVEELVAGLVINGAADLIVRLRTTADGTPIEPITAHGAGDSQVTAILRDPAVRAICERARATGTPVTENDLKSHSSALFDQLRLRSIVVMPIDDSSMILFATHDAKELDRSTVVRLHDFAEIIQSFDDGADPRSEQVRRLVIQLTEAEDRERQRIASLLHDDLQQTLAGIKVHIDMAGRHARENQYITDRLATAVALLDDAIERSRSLSHELSPPMLRMRGIVSALRVLATEVRQTHRLRVAVHASNEEIRLSELAGLVAFRAVQDLLLNTVKHSGADDAEVDIDERDDGMKIVVGDHGHGFDVDAALNHDPSGGLGLLSLRERIEAIGGLLEIESSKGSGSTFTIFLPREAMNVESLFAKRPGGVGNEQGAGRSISVLVVDDHAVIRKGLCMLLNEEADLEVVGEASGGQEAVDLALRIHPDVVVMDLTMPGMPGDEATRAIVASVPNTRVIGLSMHSQEEARDRMLASGASAYLTKAGPSSNLLDAIRGREPRRAR